MTPGDDSVDVKCDFLHVAKHGSLDLFLLKICVINQLFRLPASMALLKSRDSMKTCNASRVIEFRKAFGARSANLVGETKVDRGNQSFPQMCVRRGERIKSPLMALAQLANHHDAVTGYSA
jgi:hypothetical protein